MDFVLEVSIFFHVKYNYLLIIPRAPVLLRLVLLEIKHRSVTFQISKYTS